MNVAYGKESFPSQGPVVNLGEIVSLLTALNLKSTIILCNDAKMVILKPIFSLPKTVGKW